METDTLFIALSPKIKKQLELTVEKKELTFYEALGLGHDFSTEDLARAFNRAQVLLCHLKYHPQYKEEAESVAHCLALAVSILQYPQKRTEYDLALRSYLDEAQKKTEADFFQLIRTTAEEGSLTAEQKKDLLPYAIRENISPVTALALLDQIPTRDKSRGSFIAEPPQLTASLPRYLETPAFQILLAKNTPLVEKLHILRCSHCNNHVPITHLACSCGSLMRGKIICLECAFLFPHTALQCPLCARESNLMLELTNDDARKVHALMEHHVQEGPFSPALETGRDLLAVRPGDERVGNLLEVFKEKAEMEESRNEGCKLQNQALEAWGMKRAFQALQLFHQASEKIALSNQAMEALARSTDYVMKKMRMQFLVLLILGILFFFLCVTAILYGSGQDPGGIQTLGVLIGILSGVFFLLGFRILLLTKKYQSKTDNILKDRVTSPRITP